MSADLTGKEIQCADCHSTFVATPPPEKAAKEVSLAEDTGDEFQLSESFERPKYQPLTKRELRRDELETLQRPTAPPATAAAASSPAAPPRPAPAGAAEEFYFACPTCGTKLSALPEQIGHTTRCGDCRTELTVPKPPPRKKRAQTLEQDDGGITVEGGGSAMLRPARGEQPAAGTKPPPSKLTPEMRALLDKAQREQRDSKQVRRTLAQLPYPQRLFGFLASGGVLHRGMLVSMGVCFMASLFGLMLWLIGQGNQVLFVAVLVPLVAVISVPTLLYWSNICLTVVQDTANGNPRIEGWEDDMYMDLLTQLFLVIVAFMAATTPGVVLAAAATAVGIPPYWMPLAMALSLYLLFPINILSILEGGHFWNLASAAVLKSLRSSRGAWLQFYGESLLLAVVACGLVLVCLHDWLLVRIVVSVALVGTSFVYSRVLGLAAAKASLAFAGESEIYTEISEEEDAEGAN